MDSLTHIAIGACIGELFLGKKIGMKAMVYGSIAASLPDLDFIASFWLGPAGNLLAHRGFTHSFLFALLSVGLLAFILRKRHFADKVPVKIWLAFMGTEIFIHLILDSFNAYGTGWFEPFNHLRVSYNLIFVADPFFSVWPGIAVIFLLIVKSKRKRKAWAFFGLLFCSFYLIYCIANKFRIDNSVRYSLIRQGIHYSRYFSTPTPFNNWLWFVVAETDSGFQIGYRSVFDGSSQLEFHYFKRNENLLKPFYNKQDLQKLVRFSQGYYTADTSSHGVAFNDLRFGQILGWQNPEGPFVFHFYLQERGTNLMVVQRGRFANWNRESLRAFINRIRGYQ